VIAPPPPATNEMVTQVVFLEKAEQMDEQTAPHGVEHV